MSCERSVHSGMSGGCTEQNSPSVRRPSADVTDVHGSVPACSLHRSQSRRRVPAGNFLPPARHADCCRPVARRAALFTSHSLQWTPPEGDDQSVERLAGAMPSKRGARDKASSTKASSPTTATTAAASSSASAASNHSAIDASPLGSASSPVSSPVNASSAGVAAGGANGEAEAAALPLWLTEGSTQRDKSVLCESVYIYTPDGKQELIKNARVQFVAGRRYGLIGRNGIGKSTLLHHVYAGTLPGFPRYLRVVYVQQHDIVHVDDEVLQYVCDSDAEKKYLEAEEERLLRQLEDDDEADAELIQERLEGVTDRLAVMDARRAVTRASAILTGLGFTQDMQKAQINSLSGGWKQRVALACALFIQCDLLLLVRPHASTQTHLPR